MSKDLLGKEVEYKPSMGKSEKAFIAYYKEGVGMTIKDLETGKLNLVCIDVKDWDNRRQHYIDTGQPLKYGFDGKAVLTYLEGCAARGIFHAGSIRATLKYNPSVAAKAPTCPSMQGG